MKYAGRHATIDTWGADPTLINNTMFLKEVLCEVCTAIGATIIHSWNYKFTPQGVTVIIGLAESHAAIHSYPEESFYSADIYTCGDLDPVEGIKNLAKAIPGHSVAWLLRRGSDDPPERIYL